MKERLLKLPEDIYEAEHKLLTLGINIRDAREDLEREELKLFSGILFAKTPENKPKYSNDDSRKVALMEEKSTSGDYLELENKVKQLEYEKGVAEIASKKLWAELRCLEALSRIGGVS